MDERDHLVFWLNGLAGTGKSAIAQTFAERAFADGMLGASFFCSRGFGDQSDLRKIFATFAFQLAYTYPLFRNQLLGVLRVHPDIGQASLVSQAEALVVNPLKATGISTLIIIDALDECKDEEPASIILSILSRYVDKIPGVKFFITGRPEPRINSGFRLNNLRSITEVLKLHDVERSLVDTDIKLFLSTHLTNIAECQSHGVIPEGWPSPSDINILCEQAAGLFIYASGVVEFASSQLHQPPERLALLPQNIIHEGGSGVDTLYTEVLTQAFYDELEGPDLYEVFSRLRLVAGAVSLAFSPLSIKALSGLLHGFDTPSDISDALWSLHSLLLFPGNIEDPICVFHKSFPDFLTDQERCKDNRFFIDPLVHHTELLLSCLNLMKKRLKKNICNLDDHAILSEVDIFTRRKEYIGDALEYACQFWTKHLMKISTGGHGVEEVHRAIEEFFTKYLLFWIETLILMGNLNIGVHAINEIQQWYISVSCEHFICQSLHLYFI